VEAVIDADPDEQVAASPEEAEGEEHEPVEAGPLSRHASLTIADVAFVRPASWPESREAATWPGINGSSPEGMWSSNNS
jgi:hypothetical protein